MQQQHQTQVSRPETRSHIECVWRFSSVMTVLDRPDVVFSVVAAM